MVVQPLGRSAAVKYVIRALLDAHDPRALSEDFAGCLGKRRKELRLSGFEVRFQRCRLQSAHQCERDEKRCRLCPIERDRAAKDSRWKA